MQRPCAEGCFFISGLTASTVIFGIARSLLVFYVLVNSSQTLHNKMFESILRAPVLFFDRNPIGKSDTKLIGNYVLLTHLMSDCVSVFESGGKAWNQITLCVDSLSIKSFTDFLPEKIGTEGHTSFYSSLCVWNDKRTFTLQNDYGSHLRCAIGNAMHSMQTYLNVVDQLPKRWLDGVQREAGPPFRKALLTRNVST